MDHPIFMIFRLFLSFSNKTILFSELQLLAMHLYILYIFLLISELSLYNPECVDHKNVFWETGFVIFGIFYHNFSHQSVISPQKIHISSDFSFRSCIRLQLPLRYGNFSLSVKDLNLETFLYISRLILGQQNLRGNWKSLIVITIGFLGGSDC